jgi:phosphate-selective porin OprO/OprP
MVIAALTLLVTSTASSTTAAAAPVDAPIEAAVEAEPTREHPLIGFDDAPYIATPDGRSKLSIGFCVQTDGRFFEGPSSGAVDQFLIRRMRLRLDGTVARIFELHFAPELSGGTLSVQDAYVDLRPFSWLGLAAGKLRSPFGLERLRPDPFNSFGERGFPSLLAPDRDIGAELHGSLLGGALEWIAGVFDGAPDNGSVDGDTDAQKDLEGRIFLHPFGALGLDALAGIGIGIAGTYGGHHGTATQSGLVPYTTSGKVAFFNYDPAVIAGGVFARVSPQASVAIGPFGLIAELVIAEERLARGDATRVLTHSAWGVSGSLLLTGERASELRVRPADPLDLESGAFGALELVARIDQIALDPAAFEIGFADPAKSARRARAFAVGLNWYANLFVRVLIDFERTALTGGAKDGDRTPENLLLSRLQIYF